MSSAAHSPMLPAVPSSRSSNGARIGASATYSSDIASTFNTREGTEAEGNEAEGNELAARGKLDSIEGAIGLAQQTATHDTIMLNPATGRLERSTTGQPVPEQPTLYRTMFLDGAELDIPVRIKGKRRDLDYLKLTPQQRKELIAIESKEYKTGVKQNRLSSPDNEGTGNSVNSLDSARHNGGQDVQKKRTKSR